MGDNSTHSFTGKRELHVFAGLLFDMDGTIIDSTNALTKNWQSIGTELGIDPNVILATSHGRRTIDVLAKLDPSRANWEYVKELEATVPKRFGSDATEIPGSRQLLSDLSAASAPWAIVTSGTLLLVKGWLDVMKLSCPQHLVTAEDVLEGKPDPACYELGRDKLGLTKDKAVLVLEDAPAGVKAGKAAGFSVVGLATSHTVWQLKEAGADWIVRDMRSVKFKQWDKKLQAVSVEISDTVEN